MTKDMTQKIVLVTGAARGIGRAAARQFAARGAKVYAADLSEDDQDSIKCGDAILFRALDVTSEVDVAALVDEIVTVEGRLDCAFNNAGILLGSLDEEWDVERFEFCMDINVTGVMRCMKHEIRAMKASGGGAIVNTSSIAGIVGISSAIAYTASKHAVIGMTRAAALQNAEYGIRINAVCPGPTDTAMTAVTRQRRGSGKAISSVPMERSASPDEIAAGAVWLCSDAASYVTGHPLVIDGGFVAK